MNIEFLSVFLLAHFLGDFVFQTNKIARMKEENLRGVLYHSSIILFFQVALLSVYGVYGILAGIFSAMTHVVLDAIKLVVGPKIRKITLAYFLLDQCLHIAIISVLAAVFRPAAVLPASLALLVKYILFCIIFTYIVTVMCKMLLRDWFVSIRSTPFFLHRERMQDGVFSLLLFLVMMLQTLPALLAVLLLALVYLVTQRKQYPYPLPIVFLKCSFYGILGWIGSAAFLHVF